MNRFLLLIFFLVPLAGCTQKVSLSVSYAPKDPKDKTEILYREGERLGWEDFRGKPQTASDAAAVTNAGFGVKLSYRSSPRTIELNIEVNCSFSTRHSWVRPDQKNQYILNHEQHHFDIAYLHTRVFMERLRQARFTADNVDELIQKIYNKTAQEMEKMQNDYDRQTDHSREPEQQALWDARIDMALASLAKQ